VTDEPEPQRRIEQLSSVDPDWLARIYEARLQRFLHDNAKIWSTGALLVPLSLAPFLALGGIEQPQTAHFVFFGLASFVLMLLWLVIAESHRKYQDRSLEWMREIEHIVGASIRQPAQGIGSTRFRSRWARRALTLAVSSRWARRALTLAVPVMWVAAGFWWPR